MKKLFLFIAILAFAFPVKQSSAAGLKGRWTVRTVLVAAQEAVNQNYEPDHIRIEKWVIKGNKRKASLTSHAGTIAGKKVGKAWVFEEYYDTGLGIITHMEIVARQLKKTTMKGTIKARYYSAQFGYLLGIDAWSFKGRKGRR